MKRIQILIPMVIILMLTLFTTPVLAAKEKTEKIQYTLFGSIDDQNTGKWGTISLTFSGALKGAPDFEEIVFLDEPVNIEEESYFENYWFDGILDWKSEVQYSYVITGWQTYSSYRARWYSSQPTYNGKLVTIWNDGCTATFTVGLSPVLIEKFSEEGSSDIEGNFNLVQDIYWWDTETAQWVYDRTEIESNSYSGSGSYASSTVNMEFTAKIQSKGMPPIQGTISLSEYTYVSDQWQYGSLLVSGNIGDYYISCYSSS